MIQSRGCLCFPLKRSPGLIIPAQLSRQYLDRDRALEILIDGLIDVAHAAPAEFLPDDVMARRVPGASPVAELGRLPDRLPRFNLRHIVRAICRSLYIARMKRRPLLSGNGQKTNSY